MSYPDAVARSKAKFGSQPFLLLLNVEMPDPAGEGFRLLVRTEKPFAHPDEQYWLYLTQRAERKVVRLEN